ncbi:hypothetical protein HQQ80_17100 [Microbacteriaceae bacterium VKM Ac-2855]|nr:hypothetical protein [Microbacteriaceae bacterium VKM Ac-2855]
MAEIDVASELTDLIAALEHPGHIHPAFAQQVSAEAERLLRAETSRIRSLKLRRDRVEAAAVHPDENIPPATAA